MISYSSWPELWCPSFFLGGHGKSKQFLPENLTNLGPGCRYFECLASGLPADGGQAEKLMGFEEIWLVLWTIWKDMFYMFYLSIQLGMIWRIIQTDRYITNQILGQFFKSAIFKGFGKRPMNWGFWRSLEIGFVGDYIPKLGHLQTLFFCCQHVLLCCLCLCSG